jgi:nucleotide-binding universal stress UspA family protein
MTLVVGYSPAKADRSALDLGATLARSLGTDLLVVAVVPARWPTPISGGVDREYAEWSRAEGERAAEDARAFLGDGDGDGAVSARVVAVPGRSVAATLAEQAAQTGAAMVVVGSAEHGMVGRVVVGSTANRLLHSSPIPVGIAPRGFRTPPGGRVSRATCSFRTDAASRSALEQSARICRETGALLRVATFGVLGATMYPPEVLGEKLILETFMEETRKAQEAEVAALPGGGEGVELVAATGRDWPEALGRLDWHDGDVPVVGSSPTGLLSQVFIGTNATRIVRHSPVPAIVVPH